MQTRRNVVFFCFLAVTNSQIHAQQTTSVAISEPTQLSLREMFQRSDKVVLVKIISGDSESYNVAVYKGEVVESFKGTSTGQAIYFGPYIGMKIGWEYVVFLKGDGKELAPRSAGTGGFGKISYSQVFNEGYSAMETSYECVFPGKDTAQKCDYAVRVCTDYIVLPKSIRRAPPAEEDTPFGCRWVRKKEFLSLLETFR